MKDDDQANSPLCSIFDIENNVEQSEHSVQYLVFSCADEYERDKFSKQIVVDKDLRGRMKSCKYVSEY